MQYHVPLRNSQRYAVARIISSLLSECIFAENVTDLPSFSSLHIPVADFVSAKDDPVTVNDTSKASKQYISFFFILIHIPARHRHKYS